VAATATGTFVSKKAVQPYIPAEVLVNATVKFGKSHKDYTLRRGSAPFDLLGDETERQAKKKRADDEDREIISAKRSKPNDTVTQVTASHILVKHRDSRNPSSWREASITRSKQQAVDILSGYIAQIQQGAQTFEQIAKQFSDCSSAKRGGDLGPFRRGEMQAEFENVAYVCESSGLSHHSPNVSVGKEVMLIHMLLACSFGLRVGETSGIVSTASGVHIIKRTA
jgi:parvulin-like peptidyl-prolyl isomerase